MIDSSSPNQPIQNYEIVNPTLETQVATLLPSVAGYGGNLRSTNTIIPIVDLTAAAEGTTLPESLQQALAFGSQTAFQVINTASNIITNTGFWRIVGTATARSAAGSDTGIELAMTDGLSTKKIWQFRLAANSTGDYEASGSVDLVVFVDTGITVSATSLSAGDCFAGSVRQLASKDGVLVDPAGFA